jgi:hypothetical protein
MSQMVFDEGLASRLDTMYRSRDMVRRRRLARAALGAAPGEHIVDVGCGPGFSPGWRSRRALAGRACQPGPRRFDRPADQRLLKVEPTVLQTVSRCPSEWPLTWHFFIRGRA